jgi:biotin carboxyl carrier protein
VLQVGVFRRGRYAAGKKVGKGNVANVGDQVKKGQTLGYVEQLGTFVEVKVSSGNRRTKCCVWR